MALTEQQKAQHLYWRAGFGLRPSDLTGIKGKSAKEVFQNLLKKSEKIEPLKTLSFEDMPNKKDKRELSKEEKREIAKQMRENLKLLNSDWINRLTTTESVFREKMTVFWHNHFACYIKASYAMQLQSNTLRKHALGKFGTLLMEVSKDPAMLQYLSNQQNRKKSPNENFARELLELFTLGRGNYSEKDIKEAARAFTGWGFDENLNFKFREAFHDDAPKTFLGKTGNFKGEDIIKIILENPKTAEFITQKVYKFFVNEKIDALRVAQLAKRFYDSNYDIADLMTTIFTSDWFYDEKNVGCQIKSPVELLVGFKRTFQVSFKQNKADLFVQKALGQLLFYPPNVAGWAGGKNWIDSSTLLFRLRLCETILNQTDIDFSAKDDGDVDTEKVGKNARQIFSGTTQLNDFQVFQDKSNQKFIQNLEDFLLQKKMMLTKEDLLENADTISRDTLLKKAVLRLISVPEYQLC